MQRSFRTLPVVLLTLLLLMAIAHAACASSPARPVAAPSRVDLEAYLARSPWAAAIAGAASAQGLLATAESNIADLEAVTAALGIGDIGALDDHAERVAGEAPMLFAALDERRRGSRTGDVAHWVAVALLALDATEPAAPWLRGTVNWQADYLDAVLELRRLHLRGELEPLALSPVDQQPRPYRARVVPTFEAEHRPVFRARRQTGYWPVFDAPGGRAIAGTIALEEGREVEWDELVVLVRGLGSARVLAAPEEPQPRLRLADDGGLAPDGSIRLQDGQDLEILLRIPGEATLALLAPGSVVAIPWRQSCCQLFQRADAEWWVRLSSGDAAGTWLLAAEDRFSASSPALEEEVRRARERRARRPRLRLGPLSRAGMVEVYGGVRLSYWLRGATDGRPLFVLHDSAASSRLLHEPLTEMLGEQSLLFFHDPRGTGYSEGGDHPALLEPARAAIDLDQMRRATELERIDMLALAGGTSPALRYALDYPQHVGRIVLVEPELATDLHDRLDRIAAPVLIVAAGDLEEPPAAMLALAEALPDARLEIVAAAAPTTGPEATQVRTGASPEAGAEIIGRRLPPVAFDPSFSALIEAFLRR